MGIREIEIAAESIIIHELDNVCDSITGCPLTGSWLWRSAIVLAEFMSTHLHFQTKSVLELGAGAGLPGLTAARLGATRVVLTDIQLLLPGLINNVVANGLEDRVEVRELVWGSDESEMSRLGELGEFDIVLMSDVFYDAEEMVGLGKTLKKVCGKGTMVWAVSEMRPWTSECVNELMSQGFGVIESPCQLGGKQDNNNNSLESFAVYRLIPPIEENCHVA
ncbi:Lysine methyltransferase [Melia azedarach]|uniref:Lysine methyltransferase n=1 Tax=Melia azedarach TaxID=155640 RepID=A0ACC1Z1Q8_MELAZ|nr:Lysine methyltransferase [Melia azedarach]